MNLTLPLSELAALSGVTRDMIRDRVNKGGLPWEDEKQPEKQRRYSGFHVMALSVAKMLEAQGLSVAVAADAVFSQRPIITRFLAEVKAGQEPGAPFVAVLSQAMQEADGAIRWFPTVFWGTGTEAELVSLVTDAIRKTGTVDLTGARYVGGPHLATVHLGEAYRLAKWRAAEAGYIMVGDEIHKIEGAE